MSWECQPPKGKRTWVRGLPKAVEPQVGKAAFAAPSFTQGAHIPSDSRGLPLHAPGSQASMPSQVQAALGSGQEPWL